MSQFIAVVGSRGTVIASLSGQAALKRLRTGPNAARCGGLVRRTCAADLCGGLVRWTCAVVLPEWQMPFLTPEKTDSKFPFRRCRESLPTPISA